MTSNTNPGPNITGLAGQGNTPTPPTPPIPGPNNDLQQAINQWYQQQWEYQFAVQTLMAQVEQMIALLKAGKVEEAFNMAQQTVLPGTMNVQGQQMANLATSMNISSVGQEFTTGIQNAIAGGGQMTPQQAEQFIMYLKQMYDALEEDLKLNPKNQWMDPTTAQNIINSIDKLCGEFEPGLNPDQLAANLPGYAGIIAGDINTWSTNPTQMSNGIDQNAPDETGQQHMQNIQADIQQWTDTVGAQSQALQAQEQFAANTFNQYMNTCSGIFQASQQQEQVFVQNQKSQ